MSSSESEDDFSESPQVKKFVLFLNEQGYAMHFLVQLRNIAEEYRISALIKEHFGSVTRRRSEFGAHTIVLVDDKALSWCHYGDVFKASYIDACVTEGRVLDISGFLKDTSREFTPQFNFMRVVYFKEYSWETVPDRYRVTPVSEDSDTDDTRARVTPTKSKPITRDSEDSDTDDTRAHVTPTKSRAPRGPPYSRREREAILRYVVDHYATVGKDTLKGRSLWKNMERARVCARTWQSMKEHFLKNIAKDLGSYKLVITPDQAKDIRKALGTK